MTTLDQTRIDLTALRNKHGAESPKGYGSSNMLEQFKNYPDYERPSWATHESQTLPFLMKQQAERLAAIQ